MFNMYRKHKPSILMTEEERNRQYALNVVKSMLTMAKWKVLLEKQMITYIDQVEGLIEERFRAGLAKILALQSRDTDELLEQLADQKLDCECRLDEKCKELQQLILDAIKAPSDQTRKKIAGLMNFMSKPRLPDLSFIDKFVKKDRSDFHVRMLSRFGFQDENKKKNTTMRRRILPKK